MYTTGLSTPCRIKRLNSCIVIRSASICRASPSTTLNECRIVGVTVMKRVPSDSRRVIERSSSPGSPLMLSLIDRPGSPVKSSGVPVVNPWDATDRQSG
jgi:hypothetical protein